VLHQESFPAPAVSTVVDLLRSRAGEGPDLPLYTFLAEGEREAGALTRGALDGRARAIAAALQEAGLAGERALLLFPPGLDFVAAFFGCLYAGVVAVPAYPPRASRVEARLWEIFRDARPRAVLTTAALRARLEGARDRAPELAAARWIATDLVPDEAAGGWRDPDLEPGSLAFLQYTSGSTSSPKGVMVTHGNLIHNERMIQSAFRQAEGSVVVSWLPLYHDMGLIGGVLQPLFSGARCVLMSPWAFLQSPVRWLEAISRYRATTSGGPNFAYELCVRKVRPEQREGLDLSSWEVAFNGAEPVRAETLDAFAREFAPQGFRRAAFHPCYGLAEATLLVTGGGGEASVLSVDSAALEADRVLESGGSGRRLAGSGRILLEEEDVRIVDPATGLPCGADRVGEIWVAGPHVAAGYWNRPEETALVFGGCLEGLEGLEGEARRYLRTGDLGFLRGGELFVTGRLKDLIILRGRNLYPQDVELTVEGAHPALRPGSGAAFPVDLDGEERLVVVHELEARARGVDVEEVARAVRQAVAEEHEARVHEVVLLPAGAVPKTSSGKIQRRASRAAYLAGSLDPVGRSLSAPVEIEEPDGLSLLRSLIGPEAADASPSLPVTALGLDSLGAVELAGRIEAATGVALSPVDLLRGPSLAELAGWIAAAAPEPLDSPSAVAETEGDHPLSAGQRGLWFEERLAPAVYNLPTAFRVPGKLDAEALRRGLNALALRHPAWRTTFPEVAGGPVQRVQEALPPGFVEEDASGWSAERLAARLEEEAWRPFDLAEGPLVRVLVLALSGESILVFTVHHLVADLASLAVAARELGEPGELPPLALRYTDWVRWQERRLAGPRGEELWRYWNERLRELPALDLPTDRPRPPVRQWRGGSRALRLPEEIRGLSGGGTTLFATLLAAFQALLSRYSGQEDLAVGSPTSGRDSALAGLVGYFVNPVVLRADLSGSPGFRELASRTREASLAALEHADLPFPLLAERLQPERDASRAPVFQVLFAWQSVGLGELALGEEGTRLRLGDLTLESLALAERRAPFDLQLMMAEAKDWGIVASLQFDAALFDGETAARMLGHLATLLDAAAADPEKPVGELPILTDRERAQLLVDWNDTGEARREGLLHEPFLEQARRTPDAPALVCGEESLTYAELARRSGELARQLVRMGVGPEVRVGISLPRTPEMVISLLAVLRAGGAYVPMDPSYPAERLAFLREDSGAVLVLDRNPVSGDAPRGVSTMGKPTSGNLAYLIYTSGSTGRPKGVAIEHGSAAAFVRWAGEAFPAGHLKGVLAATSINFDLSIFEIFVPLSRGGTVILAQDALSLSGLPAAGEVTLVNTVPSALAELLRMGGLPPSVRVVNLAGEPLTAELAGAIYEQCPSVEAVCNLYGPSEDTTYSTWDRVERGAAAVSIGRPVAGTRAYGVDREGRLVPAGFPGELLLGGAGLARGYLGRPELTAERFVPDPFGNGERLYRTGDLVRHRPDGRLDFLGRIDHQVKIRGFRVEPGEIEAALRLEGVADAAVVAREQVLAAFYVGGPAPESLRESLRRRLPEHLVPAFLVPLEALPLNPNGKIDRKALAALPLVAEKTGRTRPQGAVEELLAGIWADLLGVEPGVEDRFFDLGGHSLLATRVVSRVREALGVDLPLSAFFERPTVAGLAREIEALQKQDTAPPVLPRPRDPQGEPLSFAQQRLWFLDRLAPGSAVYNVPAAVLFEGRLDVRALAAALNGVVRRHEALRTTFRDEVQIVAPALGLPVPVIDLAGLPEGLREAERLAAEEARRPFDLAAGPLIRAAVLRFGRLGDESHLVLVTMHHIVSDGWSMGVLLREVAALYGGSELPALPVQYADFARWQREWLRGETLEERLAPWRRRLAGAPRVLDLPTDHPRPPVQRFRGGRESAALPAEAVRSLSRAEGTTLFITLASGFAALLSRYAGQDDLLLGTAIANRERREVEDLIGFFVNTLALRADLSGAPSFRALLGRVREESLAAYAYQDVPFEAVVEDLAPARDLSRNPLVQATLVLQNAPLGPLALPGLALTPREVDTGTAKFDLTLSVTEAGGGFALSLEYDRDLFEAATARRLLGHFRVLLEAAASDPSISVTGLPLLTPAERSQILEWNATGTDLDPEARFPALFEHWARTAPEAVAAIFEDESLSYGELDRRAERLARALRSLGAGPEKVVAIHLDPSLDLPVAVLAVWKAGAAYLPLDPAHPEERLAFLLRDAGAGALLTAGETPFDLPTLRLDRMAEWPDSAGRSSDPGPEGLAYVLYTSGSTGAPKGVAIHHRGLANTALFQRRAYGLGPGDRVLQFATISFDASVYELTAALGTGAALVLADRASRLPGPDLVRLLSGQGVTFALLPPSALAVLPAADLPALAVLNVGGEACSEDLVDRWAPGRRLLNLYGPTELTVLATSAECEAGAGRPPRIGRPLPNSRAWVVDAGMEWLPVGVAGELCLAGAGLARGYVGRPDLTAERFVPDPWSGVPGARLYRTGDLARRLPDGSLDFLGRIDHQVKIRGFRVEPGEVEAALRAEGALDAAVVARDQVLAAFYVGGPPPETLRESLRRRLPEHLVPAFLIPLEALPLNPNGKVDRRALDAMPLAVERAERTLPRTPVEALMADLWAGVLGVERVGVAAGFFDLGGHSLLATRLLSRVRDAFGVELPLRALFEEPTVAGLAARVERARGGAVIPPIEPVGKTAGPRPPSFAQQRLWFLHQLAPESPFYNMAGGFLCAGDLDEAALRASFEEIARVQEALRTRFPAVAGSPVQEVLPEPEIALPVIDLTALPPAPREEETAGLAAREARRPFDLARGPLLRLALLRLEPERRLLLATLHHIVSDGWSMGVLFRDFTAAYGALAQGRPSPLAAPPVQYADFAVWQRRRLEGEVRERELAYWSRQLAGAPALELHGDRPRPAVQSFRGAALSIHLPGPLVDSLRALARERGATLFLLLLAAFKAVLARSTGQDEIVLGTPVANRGRSEIEGLIGFFVNTLVLRTDVSGDPPFPDFLARVRETALGAWAHQTLPFEMLVEALEPERDLGRQPLFQMMVQLLHDPVRAVELPGVRVEPLDVDPGTAHFDLGLDLLERPGGIQALARYATDLFDPPTVRRLLEHLRTLLEGLATAPGSRLSELPLLSEAQLHQVSHEWNDTAFADVFVPVHRRFSARAAEAPEIPAVAAEGFRLTYGELERRSNRLAHHLRALGVGEGRPVGLGIERTPEMAVAMLAIWKAGGAFLPLDSGLPRPRLRMILEDAFAGGEGLILTEVHLADHLSGSLGRARARLVLLDGKGAATIGEHPDDPLDVPVSSSDLAYLIYTSGTSGRPKAVLVEHGSLANVLADSRRRFGWDASDRMPCLASFSFDIFLFELLNPLLAGGAAELISLHPVPDVPRLLDRLPRMTRLHAVPALMREIVDEVRERGRAYDGLRTVFVGGDRVPDELLDDLLEVFPKAEVRVLYGPTEGTIIASSHTVPRGGPARARIGRPLGNVTLRLRDRHGNPVPVGVPGEIAIGGVAVARGYLGREDLTREKFIVLNGERLYRTGDLARFLPDGTLEFLGRADSQIKVRGYRVEPGDIEAALAHHPAVREAAVVAREAGGGDRRLVAYLACDLEDAERAGLVEPEALASLESEQVEQWRTVYDTDVFGRDLAGLADPTFNIGGWNSSFDGAPIPEEEMREWVDGTVGRLLARLPEGARVLEIGCGTGLLLFRVAPHCSRYVGTDFSATTLATVRRVLDGLPEPLNVELRQALAGDFTGVEPGSFDAVVLNSVAQYFPSVEYLVRVLEGAVEVVAPGGFVFLGDLRSLPLLRAFHAAVEVERAPASLPRERALRRLEIRLGEEPELALDPELFGALAAQLPRVGRVEVQLRRGRRRNELTAFRYDAVLLVGEVDAPEASEWDWGHENLTLPDLARRLAEPGAPEALVLRQVPNARVAAAVEALALLDSPEGPETVGELRQALATSLEEEPGLDPEDFWALEEEVPYRVGVTWSDASRFFDVVLRRVVPGDPIPMLAPPAEPPGHVHWSRYANNPLRQRLARSIVPRLRAFLEERLPDYMVPSAFVLLDRLPRNRHGKVDRKALPAHEQLRAELDEVFVAPSGEVEETLAEIWRDLLEVDRVGAGDNFFALGGHSLLATRVISRVRQSLGIEVPLRALFEEPTVAGLAARVREASSTRQDLPIRRAERAPGEELPLSFAQQRLWFLDQLAPGSAAYNMPGAFRIAGPLDFAALAASLGEIARRHEALRTRFLAREGRPVQVIDPPRRRPLPVVDLAGLPAPVRAAEAGALAAAVARQPFDLAAGPLLRTALLRLGPEEHLLAANLHHIVADGWSMGVLYRELTALYEGRPLPEPEVQYADWALWQRDWLEGEVRERELAYWRAQLAGLPPLEFPADRPRPAVQSFRGAGLSVDLPAGLRESLEAVGRPANATLYMLLLAGFAALLHRHAGQEDFAVGSPVANRGRVEVEGLIGFFVNTLVLRADLSGDPTFGVLVERMRETALGAYAHQSLPFEMLVEALEPERDLGRQPLFQMMFQLIENPAVPAALSGARVEPVEIETGTAHFDLGVDVVNLPERLKVQARYATDLFDAPSVARLLSRWGRLLAAAAEDPDRPVSQLPLLSAAERHQLAAEWNDTALDVPRVSFLSRFEAWAAERPEAVAVEHEGERLTYGELDRRSGRLAGRLRIEPGRPVGLRVERGLGMVIGLLAIWKAGGAFLPLDPDLPEARLAAMLEDAGNPAVISERDLTDEDGPSEVRERAPEDLAYLIFTSGTTGRPKAVQVEEGSLANLLAVSQSEFGWDASDRMPCLASFSFDIFLFELLNPLAAGGTAVLVPVRPAVDVDRLASDLGGFTRLHAVPALMRQIVDRVLAGEVPAPRLRTVFVGGEAVPADLLDDMRRAFPRAEIRVLYGPTEGTVICTSHRVAEEGPARPLLGRPLGNMEVRLLDRAGEPVPIGVPGEVWLGGAGVSRGYLNREELTRERYVEGDGRRWYRTGDLARWLPDGTLEFRGRADDQVKIRGFRVEPGEVEAVLASHPAVREAVVVAREGRLVAYVVGGEETELRSFLRERLPEYMVPSAIVALDALPLTRHGKVDRRALPAPGKARPGSRVELVAPRGPVEEALAGIWASLLEVERVGIHDNFFDLGGHSLLATRVVAAIRRELGAEIPLRALFERPTVAQLAGEVARASGPVESIPRQPRQPGDANRFPVSFSQLREWLLVQFEPESPAYNISGALRLTGPLRPEVLEEAVNAVVARHESLRTTFEGTAGEPVQVVAPSLRVRVPLIDLTGLEASSRGEVARRLAQEEADAPLDLARGPLLRASLVRLGAEEHALLHTTHHIVSDGWSTQVFFRELTVLYGTLLEGHPSPLPELPVQYPDFAVWQRERLQGETLEAQLGYWRGRLGGAPPSLDLPTDRPRPPVRTGRGRRADARLAAEATAALRDLARAEGASLFMALLAVTRALLGRWSGQDDLSLGTFISNRRLAELDGVIGFFVNTLVLRTDLAGEPTFRQLLGREREVTLGAYAHQDVPFEKVLEALHPERDPSRTPLFQVLLVLQNFPARKFETGGLTLSPLEVEMSHAAFDLSFMLDEVPEGIGGIGGYCEYSTDLFEEGTVRRLLAHLAVLAEAAAAEPDRPVAELPLLSAPERLQLLSEAREEVLPEATVHALFEAQAVRTPDTPAVEAGETTLSYAELNARADRLAGHLRALGVGPETLVGLALPRSPEMIVAILGVLKAGGGYLPLDPAYPEERRAFMLEDSSASVLLSELPEPAEGGSGIPATPNSPAYVIYTSGSTGRPKGVVVEHRSLSHYTRVAAERNGIGPGDRVLQFASFSFDTSAEEVFPCLASGATLVLRPEGMTASIAGFLAELDRLRITVLDLPTAYWHELVAALDAEKLALPVCLRRVILGGEKASADRVAAWRRHAGPGVTLLNTYGPTEATIVSTWHEVTESLPEIPIGQAIPGAEAWVLDRRLELVPVGLPGELCVGGAGLARGYLGRPEITAERFVPHPWAARPGERLYRTGDLVRRLADGNLQFLGRTDQQIKLRGFRIEPGEIEAALRRHPAVRDAVVALHQDRQGGRRLVAYTVREEGRTASGTELRSFLKEGLPDHMVPALFADLPALPMTPSGKVDRRALPAPEEDRPDLATAYVPPRNDLERKLVEIWRQVLPVARVGVHDSFFELGGDSLLLLQVHRRLAEAVGRPAAELSVIDLFQFPTVAALAKHLGEKIEARPRPAAPQPKKVDDLVSRQRAALAQRHQRQKRRGTDG
jgi:pristinamycin I synthase-3/4